MLPLSLALLYTSSIDLSAGGEFKRFSLFHVELTFCCPASQLVSLASSLHSESWSFPTIVWPCCSPMLHYCAGEPLQPLTTLYRPALQGHPGQLSSVCLRYFCLPLRARAAQMPWIIQNSSCSWDGDMLRCGGRLRPRLVSSLHSRPRRISARLKRS